MSVRQTAMNSADGTPLPETSRDDEPQPVLVDEEEVEEVAADGPGRRHARVDGEVGPLGKRRKPARHDRALDRAGDLELLVERRQPLAVPGGLHRPLEQPGVLDGRRGLEGEGVEQLQVGRRVA